MDGILLDGFVLGALTPVPVAVKISGETQPALKL